MTGARAERLTLALEHFAVWTTNRAGSSWAFVVAALMVVVWLFCGLVFRFSDTWQLVMNTISSIVTFLMVFLLQRSQNKESLAMQIKLDEMIAAEAGASNRLIDIEDLSEDEVRVLHKRFQSLAKRCREGALSGRVSVEEEFPADHRAAAPANASEAQTAKQSSASCE